MSDGPLGWASPLVYARAVARHSQDFALLYSGRRERATGRYSLLAWHPRRVIEADDFEDFEQALARDGDRFDPAWFGYLGYGLKNRLETLSEDETPPLPFADLRMVQYASILLFDHDSQTVRYYGDGPAPAVDNENIHAEPTGIGAVVALNSNMRREEYLAKVAATIDAIRAGDFYQANITRKFFGRFERAPDAMALFERLCEVSPAPYSALLRFDDRAIISSSPECFLRISADGGVESRPIKGTAPRGNTPSEDAALREQLAHSAKDRAENLMIVDLMRHDFARACVPGSVKVEGMFEVSSYATVHHMASTLRGQLREDVGTLDCVKACFPPGSMTGAPKIRAMEWCSRMEGMARGVYSGALGWFGGDGSAELSVVIRTLLLKGEAFEFQVGGGIVADSDPTAEWRETFTKARGIAKAIGITLDRLAEI